MSNYASLNSNVQIDQRAEWLEQLMIQPSLEATYGDFVELDPSTDQSTTAGCHGICSSGQCRAV